MPDEREVLELRPDADVPEVGRWLSAMEDARRDTLKKLDGVTDAALEWEPDERTNTIGTLLYHIAFVEEDWLFAEILDAPEHPDRPRHLLPFPDRVEGQRLSPVTGFTLEDHVHRLAEIRAILIEQVRSISLEDFHTLRRLEACDVSPAWVLHHLLQHEAEHRAHVAWMREEWRPSLSDP
jgi:uncharacterized damage-inducible protein DinB